MGKGSLWLPDSSGAPLGDPRVISTVQLIRGIRLSTTGRASSVSPSMTPLQDLHVAGRDLPGRPGAWVITSPPAIAFSPETVSIWLESRLTCRRLLSPLYPAFQ